MVCVIHFDHGNSLCSPVCLSSIHSKSWQLKKSAKADKRSSVFSWTRQRVWVARIPFFVFSWIIGFWASKFRFKKICESSLCVWFVLISNLSSCSAFQRRVLDKDVETAPKKLVFFSLVPCLASAVCCLFFFFFFFFFFFAFSFYQTSIFFVFAAGWNQPLLTSMNSCFPVSRILSHCVCLSVSLSVGLSFVYVSVLSRHKRTRSRAHTLIFLVPFCFASDAKHEALILPVCGQPFIIHVSALKVCAPSDQSSFVHFFNFF